MPEITVPDRITAQKHFDYYRKHRDGIRREPEMAFVCLICGSVHILPKASETGKFFCRDCGFAFFRYQCALCSETVDGRDLQNPACRECGWRICTCGACLCPDTSVPKPSAGAQP